MSMTHLDACLDDYHEKIFQEYEQSYAPYTSEEIHANYDDKSWMGAIGDFEGLPSFVRMAARYQRDEACSEIDEPVFDTSKWASGPLVGSYKGKFVAGWKVGEKVWANLLKGRQLTGDCASWALRMAIDLNRAWKCVSEQVRASREAGIAISQQQITAALEKFVRPQATALLYSGRGHTGQGANCSRLSNWACKMPILLEQNYGTIAGINCDFTSYPKYYQLGMKYGSNGFPKAIIEKLDELHGDAGAKEWKLVKDPRAVLDLMTQGYFCHVGSMMAWRNNGNPLSIAEGSWSHAMACVGFDDRPETVAKFGDTVVFVDQSWGPWNTITNRLPDWEPWGEGMFAISFKDFARWVSSGECCVMTSTNGFAADDDLPWNNPWFPIQSLN